MSDSIITAAYIVPGQPHILLASEQSPGWRSLKDSYAKVKEEIEKSDAEIILYFSTQWLSVLGYMFQGDPNPKWHMVDPNFHEYGTMHYDFQVDADFAEVYAEKVAPLGHNTKVVNYEGFPLDVGSIVANKLINPDNKLKAAFVSCNMYSEKDETIRIGQAASQAIKAYGKKVAVVLVSNLSNRYEIVDINPTEDKISSLKDDEWNRKILEILEEGGLEDVSQLAREYGKQANADMGFKGIWWLNGLCGQHNDFTGKVFDYQPVWGTGAAIVGLYPTGDIDESEFSFDSDEGSQAQAVEAIASSIGGGDASQLKFKKAPAPVKVKTQQNTASASSKQGGMQSKKAPEPVGSYPHSRTHAGLLFVSGMGPRQRGQKEIPGVTLDSQGNITAHDVEIQTRAVLENIKIVLEESGSCMENIIDIQVFLTNMKEDFKGFNKVYAEYFNAATGPTRTTVEVGSLPTPIAVELKVIAKP
jgi:reactive intermediate/imine deaminase